jgi:hypothetical protein
MEGQAPYVVRFADVEAGTAFEVHSVSPLGVILGFERTPQGYLMLFELYNQVRAVWTDPAGTILKDLSLPAEQHTEVTLGGQVAVAQDGSLYVLSSTERGIEVHVAGAPGD